VVVAKCVAISQSQGIINDTRYTVEGVRHEKRLMAEGRMSKGGIASLSPFNPKSEIDSLYPNVAKVGGLQSQGV